MDMYSSGGNGASGNGMYSSGGNGTSSFDEFLPLASGVLNSDGNLGGVVGQIGNGGPNGQRAPQGPTTNGSSVDINALYLSMIQRKRQLQELATTLEGQVAQANALIKKLMAAGNAAAAGRPQANVDKNLALISKITSQINLLTAGIQMLLNKAFENYVPGIGVTIVIA